MNQNIECPNCSKVQLAVVTHEDDLPHPSFVQVCTGCGYHITESEWQAAEKHELPPAIVDAAAVLEVAGVAALMGELEGLRFLVAEQSPLIAEAQAEARQARARVAELEVSLADAFDWIGHLPKSADSASAVSVNDWIHQAAALLEKAPTGAGGE